MKAIDLSKKSFTTRAVHAGMRGPQPEFDPLVPGIQPSVGFLYEHMEDMDAVFGKTKEGYVYQRYGNPTITLFEAAVAELEGGEAATAFSSGMAAIHLALLAAGVCAGAGVVAALDVYGATYAMVKNLFASLGVRSRMVDAADLAEMEKALEEIKPRAVIVETISNPLLKVADIDALAELAHRHGAQLLVDNTFATPCLVNPLAHGADYAIHSATKYLNGHGDVLAGVVVTSKENQQKILELNKLIGSNLGPFEAWLGLRGLKTLPLRMRQQMESTVKIAAWLKKHPRIGKVNYPGLASHPQHALAQRLFQGKGFGAMLSFEIAGASRETAFRFMDALQLCFPVTSLGDIYTLLLHPATSSHRALSEDERAAIGISEGLVRMSVGIEDAADLIADLEQALAGI